MTNKFLNSPLYIASALIWMFTIGLWLTLWYFNPYSETGAVTIPGFLMFVVAGLGIIFSYTQKALVLLILAVVSFLPIGLYFLGTPGIFCFIGILNILSIAVASILMSTHKNNQT